MTVEDPVHNRISHFRSALLASGFRQIPASEEDLYSFLPCPLGTFSNSSSQGAEGCIKCPPGIYIISQFKVLHNTPKSMSGVKKNMIVLIKVRLMRTVKGEGHSRNGVFFEIANKKITLS